MTSFYKRKYITSEDVFRACVRRRGGFNVVNKVLTKPNESAEFARAQILQRKGLGGTTIFSPNPVQTVVPRLTNKF